MDARKLTHFLAVAENGSFTKAAEALHIAQPSLSQSIRALEHELGSPLFRRLPRAIELTSAGEALIVPARRALRAMQDAREAVRAVSSVQGGELEITAPWALMVNPATELVTEFRRRFPRVMVRIEGAEDSAAAAERVRSGLSEVAVLELSSAGPGVRVRELADYELFIALPPGMDPPEQTALPRSALRELPLVAFPQGTVTRRIIDAENAGEAVNVEVPSAQALVELVLAGVGGALLVEPHARRAARGGAHIVPLDPPLVHRVGLAISEGEPAPAVREFVKVAADVFPTPRTRRPAD
ncbi:LysR family transcriptional regulator [Nonomuraea sediminis]|uniref:LysR family transcriptional regulator n=1 Tax=Nonomuraea sediminis TaxID=2835864 RepID=UPI001BDC8C96|nr:LysR substrate-binding domain-containing protein [Nonomuraea sediminis]